ncbi:target of Nesh-SH3 [Drosophila santomea]|uniref:target of Nesh-SH3 n=1 Tax=Drosophila santomea TaxID=129105 RepID=UPI0019531932|nr:target of Nesh-SH3 [Drosophila santomea]
MNGTRKIKSMMTIRLGDVLYDDQKRLLTLCRSCECHFMTLQSFQSHLTECPGLKHIVAPNEPLAYDDARRETRVVNGRQELHIYDLEAVKNTSSTSSAIDWEAELEDPRWYSDPKPTVQPTAKTNSKENIVKEYLVQLTEASQEPEVVPAKRQRNLSTSRRPILTTQQQRRSRASLPSAQPPTAKTKKDTILVPNVLEDLKRLQETEKKGRIPVVPPAAHRTSPERPVRSLQSGVPRATQSTSQWVSKKLSSTSRPDVPASSRISEVPPPPKISEKPPPPITTKATPPLESQSMDGTQKILNKLRACGVQVKRGSTHLNATAATELNPTKNQETLDIMRKLQSKGIRCTKVKKS